MRNKIVVERVWKLNVALLISKADLPQILKTKWTMLIE